MFVTVSMATFPAFTDLDGQTLGDCLGKGAFGSVYRALNWGTGQTVAVKQVRLSDLPKSELRVIMVRSFGGGDVCTFGVVSALLTWWCHPLTARDRSSKKPQCTGTPNHPAKEKGLAELL